MNVTDLLSTYIVKNNVFHGNIAFYKAFTGRAQTIYLNLQRQSYIWF